MSAKGAGHGPTAAANYGAVAVLAADEAVRRRAYGAEIPSANPDAAMPSSLNTPSTVRHLGADHLDTPVRALMTPGVVTIVEDATVRQAFAALTAHRVHAVLVVGHERGVPLGWVTARGLLRYLDAADDLLCVRDAISEEPRTIEPGASAREAMVALSDPGITHLLVTPRQALVPEGVVSELDLAGVAVR